MESDIGRAVKLGIQRMKIRSIGSDPRKHTNDKIKSKLLADDSAPPMMAPAPPVALGLGDAQGVGGLTQAFAAAVQSNTASAGPPSQPPPAGFAGNGSTRSASSCPPWAGMPTWVRCQRCLPTP